MRALTCAILALTLSGCSAITRMAEKGATANDEAVSIAMFTLCQGASVGAIKREFNTAERAEIWAKLCDKSTALLPTKGG